MFLRGGVEYNAGLSFGAFAMLVLAPYLLVLARELLGFQLPLEILGDLAPAAAAVGILSGCASLALLRMAYEEWEMRPPLGTIGLCCLVGLIGLAGTHLAQPGLVPPPWPWVLGGVAVVLLGALYARLVRIAAGSE